MTKKHANEEVELTVDLEFTEEEYEELRLEGEPYGLTADEVIDLKFDQFIQRLKWGALLERAKEQRIKAREQLVWTEKGLAPLLNDPLKKQYARIILDLTREFEELTELLVRRLEEKL